MAPSRPLSTPFTLRRSHGSTSKTTNLVSLAVIVAVVYAINNYNNKLVLKQQTNGDPPSSINLANVNSTTNLLQDSLKTEDTPWKRELLARLDRIRVACGELCTMNDVKQIQAHTVVVVNNNHNQNSNFPQLRVPNVNCSAIIGNEDIDAIDWTFPSTIPKDLMPYFTVGGAAQFDIVEIYKHHYAGGNARTTKWTEQGLQELSNKVMKDMPQFNRAYGKLATRMVREKLRQMHLVNKSVLVIGSESPWVEAICLGLGAAQVTTLEYGRIESAHPQVKTMTPSEFRVMYQAGTLGRFDAVVTHSSLEHSGMGRYGDGLNPWGDILAMTRAWCVTKPGGTLYLGLPTGKDKLVFNAHRVYGKVRWSLITTNWEQMDADNHTADEFEQNVDIDVLYGGTGFLFRKLES